MIGRTRTPRATERDIAALADGSLPPRRRARAEQAVAGSTELQAELRDQQLALAAVRSAEGERAPASLRARVARERPEPRRARPRRSLGAVAVAGVAVLAAAVVLTLGGGAASSPSVADAAVLGARPPAANIPVAAHGRATLALPRAAGLHFPYWDDRFGWKAVGWRQDTLDGRAATTVYYRRGAALASYTIVAGKALRIGAPAHSSRRDGVALRNLAVHGRQTVTWLRRGHTCVLSSTGTHTASLLQLAAWRGGGELSH